jgi:hypothetical protein
VGLLKGLETQRVASGAPVKPWYCTEVGFNNMGALSPADQALWAARNLLIHASLGFQACIGYAWDSLNPATVQTKSFWQRLQEIFTPTIAMKFAEERFKKEKFDLGLRVSQVSGGLSSMSLTAVQLDTQSLIELFYNVYNPDLYEAQPLIDVAKLQVD